MTTPTSLPACAHNHPGVLSNIEVKVCSRGGGAVFNRPHCTVCAAIAAKRGKQASSAGEAYGVYKLDWVPPERVLEQTQ